MVAPVDNSNQGWVSFCKGIKDVGKGVVKGGQVFFKEFSDITKDSDACYNALRFVSFSITGVKHISPTSKIAGRLDTVVNSGMALIDAGQIVNDVNYFVNTDLTKERPMAIGSKSVFTAVDVISLGGWFGELGFYDTAAIWNTCVDFVEKSIKLVCGKLAHFLGKHNVFGIMKNFSLGTFLNGLLGFAYILNVADNIHQLAKPNGVNDKANRAIRTKAALDLIKNITEVALRVFMITATVVAISSVAYISTLVALGLFVASMGVVGFLYYKGNQSLIEGK